MRFPPRVNAFRRLIRTLMAAGLRLRYGDLLLHSQPVESSSSGTTGVGLLEGVNSKIALAVDEHAWRHSVMRKPVSTLEVTL